MAKMSKREMNYRIDFTKMTLTMTAHFADKAYDPSTEEYEILTRLQRDFPRLRIVRKTHRSPKTANPAKGLTCSKRYRVRAEATCMSRIGLSSSSPTTRMFLSSSMVSCGWWSLLRLPTQKNWKKSHKIKSFI